jgi:16S rRNA processing protein RimM
MNNSMQGKVRIGKVTRLHGFKGELSLKLENEYGALLEQLDHVFLEIDKKAIPFFINSVRFTAQGFALVFFDGVDDQSSAERIRGAGIWIEEESIPEEFIDEDALVLLNGYLVIDHQEGELGTVTDVVEHPGNSFLVIDKEDGEILIPINDSIVKEIDKNQQKIFIEAPEGLISLNMD